MGKRKLGLWRCGYTDPHKEPMQIMKVTIRYPLVMDNLFRAKLDGIAGLIKAWEEQAKQTPHKGKGRKL